MKLASILAALAILALCGCGGSSSSGSAQQGAISGNWQFTMEAPTDGSYVGGIQGGFLLQSGGTVTGGVVYSVAIPQPPPTPPTVCSSGSAAVTGTWSGSTVTITVNAGNQTFTLTGTANSTNSALTGTYASTAGTGTDGSPCGSIQSGLTWSAAAVPSLTGSFLGNFHSTQSGTSFRNQNFAVSGSLVQGPNVGASNATVTGTLLFQDPQTGLSDYPCLTQASVNGQISGNVVTLQIFATSGADVGQIGDITASTPVTYDSTQGGYVLHNVGSTGSGYAIVDTKSCPGVSLLNAGDSGNLCFAFGTSTACSQPITLSPFSLSFPAQLLGTTPTSQTVTLTNTDPSGATLTGLNLSFFENDSGLFYPSGGGDFNGVNNFVEQDSCASPFGSTFSLASNQSCSITIAYSPQESCPWIPFGSLPAGNAPVKCPSSLTASLTVNNVPYSADQDNSFSVPIKGAPLSYIVPFPAEVDFGSEAVTESSEGQTIQFTNQGLTSVQILPAANSGCTYSINPAELPHPVLNDGAVAGFQVARTDAQGATIAPIQSNNTIDYWCDADSKSELPNFPLSLNSCLGRLLQPQESCSLQITFVPQPGTNLAGVIGNGLDYFLELNTLQCTSPSQTDCEIDSGRFPVEIKSNPPSPLRMTPGAGLNFPAQSKGTTSTAQQITLYNDPNDPNSETVNFSGKVVIGDYLETDTCPYSIAPGAQCVLTITFTPQVTGSDPGTISLNYNGNQFQTIYLRGSGK